MTNIVTTVRKAIAPITSTGRALGLFSKALDALQEVQDNQNKRVHANDYLIEANNDAIGRLSYENDRLHDDTANALLEIDAANAAIVKIRALLPA